MSRFVISLLWKAYIVLFVLHLLSHWSTIESLWTTQCHRNQEAGSWSQQPQKSCKINYYTTLLNVLSLLNEANSTALYNLLEIINFVMFVAKRSSVYIKSRMYYDQYLEEKSQ
jgi:hypothetical protein